jgi:RNA polymerase sigma-70 factor (ECF subfamily)
MTQTAPAPQPVPECRPPPARETHACQLAAAAQAGDLAAFDEIVGLFQERLFHFLFRLTGNRHDAEDLTQETFLRAYRFLPRFDANFALSPWLFTIARRVAATHYRKQKTAGQALEVGPRTEEGFGAGAHAPSSGSDSDPFAHRLAPAVDEATPATLLEQKDQIASLWTLAQTLKRPQFEALWLRYGEGFSVAETARVLQTNSIYVKVLIFRARHELARKLTMKNRSTIQIPA